MTTNLVNGKRYIGLKHSDKFVPTYYGSGKIIKRALKKYGTENFKVEIIEECNSREELRECERKWISYYNAQKDDMFYNIAEGGQFGSCIAGFNEEELKLYKQHLSEGVKQSYINNPELRKQRSDSTRQARANKFWCSDPKKKSEDMKRRWRDNREKELASIRKAAKERVASGASKEVWKVHKHPWIGRHHTEETKKLISEHTDVHGIKNPNRKAGKLLLNGEEVLEFQLTLDMHSYLSERGIARRDRYRIIHGETIQGYSIIRN